MARDEGHAERYQVAALLQNLRTRLN
jgi:hypothetical protein